MRHRDERKSRGDAEPFSLSTARSRERCAAAARRRRRRLLAFIAPPLAALAGALAVTAAPRLWDGLPSLDAVIVGAEGPERRRLDELSRGSHSVGPRRPQFVSRAAERPGNHAEPRPSGADADRARRYVDARAGSVSFAAVDSRGRIRSADGNRPYVSASIVKAMLLAAELRRLDAEGAALDPATEGALRAMITYSDNDAADTIYHRVGDTGLTEVAAGVGMESFSVAGYWGNAQITAEDMARFFFRLDRALAGPHAAFAKGLLGSVVEEQRWGIPAAAGERWSVRFKGGWRSTELGELAHQAAELRRNGERISIAILTDAQPSQTYGQETIRGVADRLLPG